MIVLLNFKINMYFEAHCARELTLLTCKKIELLNVKYTEITLQY